MKTDQFHFVGPDNGVLSFALKNENVLSVHRLQNEQFFLQPVSHTFHGRDIFAPVAAHLSRGISIHKFGPRQKDLLRLKCPQPRAGSPGEIKGEVVYIDHFGNAITNVENAILNPTGAYEVLARGKRLCSVEACYSSVCPGEAVAVLGSNGFLEIAVNAASAAKELGLFISAKIFVRPT